jgi:hypothetical protein
VVFLRLSSSLVRGSLELRQLPTLLGPLQLHARAARLCALRVAGSVVCGLGFVLARRLGLRSALVLFVVTEVVLAIWIRDNLTLNILMLIYPIEAVKEWQAAGH